MGTAIARRLMQCGQPVHVWNRSAARAQPLVDSGASWAQTPQMLAQVCDIVISILSDEAALDGVYKGPDGLLAGQVAGCLFVDMSTVSPAKPQALAKHALAAGARFLECPVGGSVGPASEGKLLGFVGGNAADLEHARPVLSQLCRRIEHVGPLGAGATVKLAINLPLMVYWQTLSEALSLLKPLQLDPVRIVDILAETSGGPNMLKTRGPMIARALAGTADDSVSVDLQTMRKDLRAMLAEAAQGGFRLPLASLTLQSMELAMAQGLAAADCTQLPVWWLAHGGIQDSPGEA
jgi:3-hydroxyisobutyrate dehydrogenase